MTVGSNDIKLDRVKDTGRYVVYGAYEYNYGRQHYGWVDKVAGGKFRALGCDGRAVGGQVDLGAHKRRQDAADAVVTWALANLTAEALSAEFEPRVAGGAAVHFLRRAAGKIVAASQDLSGDRFQTTWNEEGVCDIYRDAISDEDRRNRSHLMLVRRVAKASAA